MSRCFDPSQEGNKPEVDLEEKDSILKLIDSKPPAARQGIFTSVKRI
jgi:hypothetical protein